MKRCCCCKRMLPADLDHFHKKSDSKDGLQPHCIECKSKLRKKKAKKKPTTRKTVSKLPSDLAETLDERWKSQATRHNVTVHYLDWLYEEQEGKCAHCCKPLTRGAAVVDHDHNKCRHSPRNGCYRCIRGLVHNNCNKELGALEKKHRSLIAYLRRY